MFIRTMNGTLTHNVLGLGEGGVQKVPKFKFSTKANRKYKCSIKHKSPTFAKPMLGDAFFGQFSNF